MDRFRPNVTVDGPPMIGRAAKRVGRGAGARRARPALVAAALAVAASSAAHAQSTSSPPPTAPSAVPLGEATSAPTDPGRALSGVGQRAGAGAPATADDATKPLHNAATPPGITEPGK